MSRKVCQHFRLKNGNAYVPTVMQCQGNETFLLKWLIRIFGQNIKMSIFFVLSSKVLANNYKIVRYKSKY